MKHFLTASVIATGLSLSAQAGAKPYKAVHSFQDVGANDGAGPSGLMTYYKGTLYGTTQKGGPSGNGTVFKLDPKTGVESVLYAFKGGSDGYLPARNLVEHDGILYGTTAFGGQSEGDTHGYNETGTIFSLDPKTGVKTTLFEFPNDGKMGYSPGDLVCVNGVLYGTTAGQGYTGQPTYDGTLYKYDLKRRVFKTLRIFDPADRLDARFPVGGMINVNGTLYGTSLSGGTTGAGAVFSYDISTAAFKIILATGHNQGDPDQFQSTPVYLNGALYMTSKGGGTTPVTSYGLGTVFKLDLTTLQATVLYSFQNGDDGAEPQGGLVYQNGLLYGTSIIDGANGGGALFSIDPTSGKFTVLHGFGAKHDGSEPVAALTDVKGTLFGTTFYGGTKGVGTIFKYKP